jgi:hypothetical protein
VETTAHQSLKRLAVAFLREHGCLAVATEVRCPISRYRVDVAGYLDRVDSTGQPLIDSTAGTDPAGRNVGRRPRTAQRNRTTVLIECKQSRSDFLRDRRDQQRLLRERAELDRFRHSIEEERIKRLEPHLRRPGSSLFPDMEEWDFAASRLPAYHDLLRRMRRLDLMLHAQTKFCMIARYALADRLYVAAPAGMIRKRELPPGWGLLECPKKALRKCEPNAGLFGDSVLRIAVKSPDHAAREVRRERLLRNIAIAASAAASRSMGVLA